MTDEGLTILGKQVREPTKKLETFENPGVESVTMTCHEFTSLCPITGQPDWGTIEIMYHPDKKCLESKSLKLYLWTFREEGSFCEALAKQICDDVFEVLRPTWVQVSVTQTPRGGIGITASAVRYIDDLPGKSYFNAAQVERTLDRVS